MTIECPPERRAAGARLRWSPALGALALLAATFAPACKVDGSALGGVGADAGSGGSGGTGGSPMMPPPPGHDAAGGLGGSDGAPGAERPPTDGPPPGPDVPRPGLDVASDPPRPIDPPDVALPRDATPPPPDLPPPPPDGPPSPPGCPEARGGPALVKVNGFCIDATEVTNADYLVFWNARRADTSGQSAACAWNDSFTPDSTGGARWPPEPGRERRPVVNVDWCDAYAFCQWAGKRLCGRVGGGALARWEDTSMLANAQWTYACTSAGRNIWPYGNSYDGDACNAERPVASASSLVDVGSKPRCRTERGVHDLSGNAEEWADACSSMGNPANDACAVVGASAFHKVAGDLSCAGSPYPDRRSSQYELRGFRCCAP